jgi:hypothetical protein
MSSTRGEGDGESGKAVEKPVETGKGGASVC